MARKVALGLLILLGCAIGFVLQFANEVAVATLLLEEPDDQEPPQLVAAPPPPPPMGYNQVSTSDLVEQAESSSPTRTDLNWSGDLADDTFQFLFHAADFRATKQDHADVWIFHRSEMGVDPWANLREQDITQQWLMKNGRHLYSDADGQLELARGTGGLFLFAKRNAHISKRMFVSHRARNLNPITVGMSAFRKFPVQVIQPDGSPAPFAPIAISTERPDGYWRSTNWRKTDVQGRIELDLSKQNLDQFILAVPNRSAAKEESADSAYFAPRYIWVPVLGGDSPMLTWKDVLPSFEELKLAMPPTGKVAVRVNNLGANRIDLVWQDGNGVEKRASNNDNLKDGEVLFSSIGLGQSFKVIVANSDSALQVSRTVLGPQRPGEEVVVEFDMDKCVKISGHVALPQAEVESDGDMRFLPPGSMRQINMRFKVAGKFVNKSTRMSRDGFFRFRLDEKWAGAFVSEMEFDLMEVTEEGEEAHWDLVTHTLPFEQPLLQQTNLGEITARFRED